MSYTTLYKVPRKGQIKTFAEYRNSYLFAMSIWMDMQKRYLFSENYSDFEETWALHKRKDIPAEHRIVLMTTFDYVMVKREDLKKVAEAFKKFATDFSQTSHYLAIADDLLKLFDDETCYAVCWCATSVSGDMWWVSGAGRNKQRRLYDISLDKDKHWFMFAEEKKNKVLRGE